jgi:hypothetical protein
MEGRERDGLRERGSLQLPPQGFAKSMSFAVLLSNVLLIFATNPNAVSSYERNI